MVPRTLGRGAVAAALTCAFLAFGAARAHACAPLACSEIRVGLPYTLGFSSDEGKIQDGNGVGTGFTYVDPPTNGTGYMPANLQVDQAAGVLKVTSTAGTAFQASNSQDNALAVGIDAPSQVTRIETTLDSLPAGSGHSEQAGLWFGNDEDNYLKLVAVDTPNGTRIQYLMEVGGVSVDNQQSPYLDLDGHNVTFSMVVDPTSQRVTASYQVDSGAPVSFEFDQPPEEFFSFDAARLDPTIGTDSFAGIFATHGGGPAPLVYRFDRFSVTKEADLTPPAGDLLSQGIAFKSSSYPINFPTSMAMGPDGRLYVSELFGTIHALTLNADHQVVQDQVITALGDRFTLGLTVDPESTPSNIILWVAHSSPSTDNGVPNSGILSRLSGPDFANREDVITGLPRAKANHGTNALHFGADGKLYIAQGGNTGAGGPNEIAGSEFGDMQEQPLSAAILVADVRNPNFDGSCNNESDIFGPPPCDVHTFATGLRNTYDFVFHSNGSIYGADNSVGSDSTFPPSPTPPCLGLSNPARWDANPPGDLVNVLQDPLNRLIQGKYYGHPDPYRDECVFYDGRFQGVPPLPNYQPPFYSLGDHRSADGIIEYRSGTFCGSLKGDLLLAEYGIGDDIRRVELNDDGTAVTRSESLSGGFSNPVPLAQGPDGTIYVGEFGTNQVTALSPVNIGCWTNRAPLPNQLLDAGGAALGGKLYLVAGEDDGGHLSSLWIYDPDTDSWSAGPPLPGPGVENPAVATDGGKLYVFGGSTHSFSGGVQNAAVFDPATNTWTTLPQMTTARSGGMAKAIGGKIYVAGGMGGDGASLDSVEIFDPTAGGGAGAWSSAANMGSRRDNAGSAVLDGKLYVFGGSTRNSDGSYVDRTLDTVEAYDPGSDSWTGRAPMPTGRQSMIVGTLNGRAQVMGGEVNPSPPGVFAANEEYDPDTDSWRELHSMPTPRHGAAAGTIGDIVYVVGGGPESLTSFSGVNEAFSFNPFPGPTSRQPPPAGQPTGAGYTQGCEALQKKRTALHKKLKKAKKRGKIGKVRKLRRKLKHLTC
jgi:glucose/arabinose dehydrogenase/N-acetylneuraminic acid mutarotase